MSHVLTVVDALCDAPARIKANFGEAIGYTIRTTDLQLRRFAIDRWSTNQQQISIPSHNSHTVAPAHVLIGHTDRVAVTVNAASTDARKVELRQQWINSRWTRAALAPTGTSTRQLLND